MLDRPGQLALETLRHELAEKARQLSELDLMLADYHTERNRLIRELRHIQSRLRDAEEETQFSAPLPPTTPSLPSAEKA